MPLKVRIGSDCLCSCNLPCLQTQHSNSPLRLEYNWTLIQSAGHQPNRYGGTTRTERFVVFELNWRGKRGDFWDIFGAGEGNWGGEFSSKYATLINISCWEWIKWVCNMRGLTFTDNPTKYSVPKSAVSLWGDLLLSFSSMFYGCWFTSPHSSTVFPAVNHFNYFFLNISLHSFSCSCYPKGHAVSAFKR